ncbi:MAG: hypothetical protein AAGJ87_10300 [Pseudomonadota bacterium]
MLSNPDLMQRLEALSLDDLDAAFPFSRRLARDNGWTHGYALRVIEEYKRFVYLAFTAGREVTPSDEVDQAWHLHLTYTRHYWGPFAEALGGPLHHGPTAGGAAENARYTDNYDATRAAYEREFGVEPPADIWPDPAERFGAAPHMRRINARDALVVRKSAIARNAARVGVLLLGLGSAGIALAQDAGAGDEANTGLMIGGLVLAAAFVGVALNLSRMKAMATRKGSSNAAGAGCGTSGGGKGDSGDGSGGGDGGSGCGGGCGGCGG